MCWSRVGLVLDLHRRTPMRTSILLSASVLTIVAGPAYANGLSKQVFTTAKEAARAEAAGTMGRWLHTAIPVGALTIKQVAVSAAGRSTRHLVAGPGASMLVSVLQTKEGFRAFDTTTRKYIEDRK